MKETQPYMSAMTGAPFLMFEFKKVVQLQLDGLSDKEIKSKILEENIFQYDKLSSIKRALPYLLKRANVLDEKLKKYVCEQPFELAKVANLYALMKSDRLFFEFMNEVICEKLEVGNTILERKDVNIFFTTKAEQDPDVAKWSDKTIQKLKQVFEKALRDSGIFREKNSRVLHRLILDEELKSHLIQIGEKRYIRALGE